MAKTHRTVARQSGRQPYHHGDLHAALLEAAEQALNEQGVESFSLRGVARRAGVSHAAPAHHFGDANGLLTALAARGFEALIGAQRARQRKAAPEPLEQLTASGVGYIDFALARPGMFRLIFSSDRPDRADDRLAHFGQLAYGKLVDELAQLRAARPSADGNGRECDGQALPPGIDATQLDAAGAWAIVHGLADLLISGRLESVRRLAPRRRDEVLKRIIVRAFR